MSPALLLTAVLQYGPSILPLIAEIHDWIAANKTEVTSEDIKQLIAYGQKTSADYLKAAGVTIPPQP